MSLSLLALIAHCVCSQLICICRWKFSSLNTATFKFFVGDWGVNICCCQCLQKGYRKKAQERIIVSWTLSELYSSASVGSGKLSPSEGQHWQLLTVCGALRKVWGWASYLLASCSAVFSASWPSSLVHICILCVLRSITCFVPQIWTVLHWPLHTV